MGQIFDFCIIDENIFYSIKYHMKCWYALSKFIFTNKKPIKILLIRILISSKNNLRENLINFA